MSMDTLMEDSDYSVSNTDAIIYAASDISGWTESLISDPNIPNSSSTSEDEYQQQHQQISTAAVVGSGDNDDLMIIVSSDESSNSTNNNNQSDKKIRIFNVDLTGSHSRSHECSICGLEFPTGQALGGHMRRHIAIITSEDKYQQQISSGGGGGDDLMIIVSSDESSRSMNSNKQIEQKVSTIFNVDFKEYSSSFSSARKLHECSICGLEFPTGQALGGHMRRHRAIIMTENLPQQVKRSNGPRILCLDLNLTPLENDLEFMLGKTDPIYS
ncbi:zinc finger protein ZAT9-like [Solanum dulcamara]|uniref:zinc finger protein ZAT9-like n=1 Tax=Solanum dulcamara TaxID=45834 RepID=UPI00248581E6|nr:zinc finger protein ZAT9-like [Solanum dulcamara]